MIRGITEVGVAVRNLASATQDLCERLGAVAGPVQRFEPYGMEFCMCRVGNVDFELMAPLGDEGPIAQYLSRYGEGIHHIGFGVDDVKRAQQDMGERGLKFVDAQPRTQRFATRDFSGADMQGKVFDTECAFTFSRPGSLLGMVLEFIEYPKGFELAHEGKTE